MSDLYIAPDGDGQPCVWEPNATRPDLPFCVARRSKTDHRVWAHLAATLPTRENRPEEPTGLGAVVETDDGTLYVRDKTTTTVRHWKRAEGKEGGQRHAWADIRPMLVVSQGYDVPHEDDFSRFYIEDETDAPTPDADRPLRVGGGDDSDVESGRCCPHCRHLLTDHNKSVWNAGYATAMRHFGVTS